ncbi:MAG TPA: TlpA disulfide reductase family protein [Candidatus Limnocylindria bacterium]|jgi:thiol-disulfide isomerase/thioredoxin|nr:TlpA disulfide reductase family protein [Candidatus Limnocylindria bacterium]
MKRFHQSVATAALALACLVTGQLAAAPALKVGDQAPPLSVAKWVQGEPVKAFETNKCYIVEFWATWCGPCKMSIPHLNALYEKFKDKDLVVIGQDVMEEEDVTDVPKFVREMGSKMTYRVALDDKKSNQKGAMAATWMEAAEQRGIPTAFVVDRTGMVAWIGHPMELEEPLLETVLSGKLDKKGAIALHDEAVAKQAALQAADQKLGQAMQDKQWAAADLAVAELEKLLPESQRSQLKFVRLDILFGKNDADGAYKLAEELGAGSTDKPEILNGLAWKLATQENTEPRFLDLADKYSLSAIKGKGETDAATLDTRARVQFLRGDKPGAIATEEKAVASAEGRLKAVLQKSLDSYKEGKLPKQD